MNERADRSGSARMLSLNWSTASCSTAPARATATLLEALREDLSLTGTKHGCELGGVRPAPSWWTASRS